MTRRRVLEAAATVALYVVIVGWLTGPLGRQLGTALSAAEDATRFDGLYSTWVLAYESHALVTVPTQVANANIYAPAPHALFYGPTGVGALPLFAPIYLTTGNPALAANVMFLGAVALTAAALHVVTARWTGIPLAGLVAGWTLLTTRWMLWEWIPTAPHAGVLFYFPFVILLATDATPSRRTIRWLVALTALQCLSDVTYVAPAVLAPLLLLALARLVRPSTRRSGAALLMAVVAAIVATLPIWVGHLIVGRENPLLPQQTLWLSGARPTSLPWDPIGRFSPMAVQPVVFVLIVLGALVRSVARKSAITPRVAWLHAGMWSAVGLLISLTPIVVWQGNLVHLPTWILDQWIPLFRYLRVPSRLGIAGLMGLTLFAGLAFGECVGRLPGRGRGPLAAAVAAVVLAGTYVQFSRGFSWPFERESLWGSYPVQRAIGADDPLLEPLRASQGSVLELPLNRPLNMRATPPPDRPFATDYKPYLHAVTMYRSIFHGRPVLNGYSSYFPAGWPARMRLADALPAPEALAALRRETGLQTIVVHTDVCAPGTRDRWLGAATGRDDLRLTARVGNDLVFEIASQPTAATPGGQTPSTPGSGLDPRP